MGREPYYLVHCRKFLDGGRTPVLTANDYIQAGLLFQLDGLEKGDTLNAWVDLKTGTLIPIEQTQKKIDQITFPPKSGNFTVDERLLSNDNITIEIVFAKSYVNGNILCVKNSFGVHRSDSGQIQFLNGAKKAALYIEAKKGTLTLSQQTVIFNGIRKPTAIKTGHFDSDTCIGSIPYYNNQIFDGALHAIRVYNRQLTDDEILYNQRVDNVRFNLGLDLSGGIQPNSKERELTMSRTLDEASPLESFDESLSTEEEECVNVTER